VKPWGLYVHIPFCPQKCPYCSFAVVVGRDQWHQRYTAALCHELELRRDEGPRRPFSSVYFGGGTPSMVEAGLLAQVLERVAALWGIDAGAEISIEVNPDTVDASSLAALRALGFNRITVGVQSFGAVGLKALGRRHSTGQAQAALTAARQAGFENIGLDLIFGVPGTDDQEWNDNLAAVKKWRPEHVSTYGLTVEEDTRFFQLCRQGGFEPVGEERQADQYEAAANFLREAGYRHYEVSNFSLPGRICRHNWGYWTGGEYLGAGQSAHSFVDGRRFWNTDKLVPYVEATEQGGPIEAGHEHLEPSAARREAIWLALRTDAGVALSREEEHLLLASARFDHLVADQKVYLDQGRLRLEPAAFALADAVGVEIAAVLDGNDKDGC
jgi:oxygen-independent coproporphyrinogen III oxidase